MNPGNAPTPAAQPTSGYTAPVKYVNKTLRPCIEELFHFLEKTWTGNEELFELKEWLRWFRVLPTCDQSNFSDVMDLVKAQPKMLMFFHNSGYVPKPKEEFDQAWNAFREEHKWLKDAESEQYTKFEQIFVGLIDAIFLLRTMVPEESSYPPIPSGSEPPSTGFFDYTQTVGNSGDDGTDSGTDDGGSLGSRD